MDKPLFSGGGMYQECDIVAAALGVVLPLGRPAPWLVLIVASCNNYQGHD
jgi:hypothetical protein